MKVKIKKGAAARKEMLAVAVPEDVVRSIQGKKISARLTGWRHVELCDDSVKGGWAIPSSCYTVVTP